MAVKIRLQRHGKKGQPFYHIVIADGRAPRDGKFIEKIGTYNPLTKPADIQVDFERAMYWLQTGAQPTETARTLLAFKGILFKNHLAKGVLKGALTEEQAQAKFDAWKNEKDSKIANAYSSDTLAKKEELKKKKIAEAKVNEQRAAAIAKKHAKVLQAQINEVEKAEEAPSAEDHTEPTIEQESETTNETNVE